MLQVSLRKSQNSQQASAVFLPPSGQPQTSLVPSRLSWYITYVCGLGEPDKDTHCWVGVGWSPLPSPTGLFACEKQDSAVGWRLVVSGLVAMGTRRFRAAELVPRRRRAVGSGNAGIQLSLWEGRAVPGGPCKEPELARGHLGLWARADQRGPGPLMQQARSKAGSAWNLPPQAMPTSDPSRIRQPRPLCLCHSSWRGSHTGAAVGPVPFTELRVPCR